jgi:hypothetical protein
MKHLKIERLVDDRSRAELFGPPMGLRVPKGRDENQGYGWERSPDPVKHVESTETRHSQIADDEIGCAASISSRLEAIDELFAIAAFVDLEAFPSKRRPQHSAHRGVIVGEQYENRCHHVSSL